jgi:two-component system, sensor histidine kinase and response regulator
MHEVVHHREEPITILVVDDTTDNIDVLEYVLKGKPIHLLRACSGRECIEIAKEQQPDVILLDIQMPEVDGFKTLQRLRESPLTESIPVILLTAKHKDPTSIEKGFRLGADEYLTKPIEVEELLVRIRMLVRIKKMEQDLSKTKADFMAMLVHDLRSPLIGVKSVIELLNDLETGTPLREEHLRMLGSAGVSLHQMLTLVNNFLDLSKYKTKSIRLYREAVPLHLLAEGACEKVAFRFKQKDITIENNIPRTLPKLYVDTGKTQQVFLNLLDNALKFTDTGGTVSIHADHVRAESNEPGKSHSLIRVSISDNGIGIPSDEMDKLFRPYQQTASARSVSDKGYGLGLSICKVIVEAHGGSISVDSEPGRHTTFYFTLPVVEQDQIICQAQDS